VQLGLTSPFPSESKSEEARFTLLISFRGASPDVLGRTSFYPKRAKQVPRQMPSLFSLFSLTQSVQFRSWCWNPSLRHRRRASIRLVGYYGYSDTRAFVTENLPTSYSHVDRIVEYINHVTTRLVLHQLAAIPIELPSCIRNLIRGV
jgi:hypothetical protein